MSTLVCFHAHPDDEAISTGGLMALAADAGHRVVLICATRGEQGEPQDGVLAEGEALWERRLVELTEAARLLGAEEPLLLGYEDSGMMGEPTNDNPECFWQADHDEAVGRLAAMLRDVDAEVLTIYDENGGYGHPDHIRVHTVGRAAAEIVGVEHVYEATMNRDHIKELMDAAEAAGEDIDEADRSSFGTPADDIAYGLNVASVVQRKKEAIMAHRSQVGPDSFFLTMPEEAFAMAFGSEWFNLPGTTGTGGPTMVDLLPGLKQTADQVGS